jgi:hypothetical protein
VASHPSAERSASSVWGESFDIVYRPLYPKEQYAYTDLGSRVADEMFRSFDPDKGVVAFPRGAPHVLPSKEFPWDKTKEVFVLSGYHSLHSVVCIVNTPCLAVTLMPMEYLEGTVERASQAEWQQTTDCPCPTLAARTVARHSLRSTCRPDDDFRDRDRSGPRGQIQSNTILSRLEGSRAAPDGQHGLL